MINNIPGDFVLKDAYPVECPTCAYEFMTEPSIAMICGNNFGYVSCPNCLESLHLEIDLNTNEQMNVELWEDHLKGSKGGNHANAH